MIRVILLARLRDECGVDTLEVAATEAHTVAELRTHLVAQGHSALQDSSIRFAVNQSFCQDTQVISAGDEVAFMPPVTGG